MKRDYFHSTKIGKEIKIVSRRHGITEIYRIPNDADELERAKLRHKNKWTPTKATTERRTYVPPKRENKIEVDLADYFYSKLEKNDFFIVNDFSIRLFDSEGDHCYIFDVADQEYKEEIMVAKFYLVENKFDESKLDNDKNILFHTVKKLKGNYKILLILPDVNFRDQRFGFEYPRYLKQISFAEVKTLWKNVFDFGYDELVVKVGDIPKTRKVRKSVLHLSKERGMLLRKSEKLRKKILSLKAETIDNPLLIKIDTHARPTAKEYRMQNKMKSINYCLDRNKSF